jgi:hypothetical protein
MGILSVDAKEFLDRYRELCQFNTAAGLHDVPSHESNERISEMDILIHYLGPNPFRVAKTALRRR